MECSICADPYAIEGVKRPAVLPNCGHTFCYECIARLCHEHLQSLLSQSESQRLTTRIRTMDPSSMTRFADARESDQGGRDGRHPLPPWSPSGTSLLSSAVLQSSRLSLVSSLSELRCPSCRHLVGPLRSDASNLLPNYALIAVIQDANQKRENQAECDGKIKLQGNRPNIIVKASEASPSPSLFSSSDTFCVDCNRLVCPQCCDSARHLHVSSHQTSTKAMDILESLIEGLLSSQTSALELIERLKLCREKHLGQIQSASLAADTILRLRIEDIKRERQTMHSQFEALQSHWVLLWDILTELVKGQLSSIVSGVKDLLEKLYTSSSANVENPDDGPDGPHKRRKRKRTLSPTLPRAATPTTIGTDRLHRLLSNDSFNIDAAFLDQLKRLSLTQSQPPPSTSSCSFSLTNNDVSNAQYQHDVIKVLRLINDSQVSPNHWALSDSVESRSAARDGITELPSSSSSSSSVPHPGMTLALSASQTRRIAPPCVPVVHHHGLPRASHHDLRLLIPLMSEGWRLFRQSEPLRDLLLYFQLPLPTLPDAFQRTNPEAARQRTASPFVITAPQVFPGLIFPTENLVTVEYVPLVQLF